MRRTCAGKLPAEDFDDQSLVYSTGMKREMDRLSALAAELVRLKVDVIVTGANANTVAIMKATSTIPIVMAISTEPSDAVLITNSARPGGNVTGLTGDAGDEIYGKRVELLSDILLALSRLGVLWNPESAPNFGPPTTIYNRFVRWARRGIWEDLFRELAGNGRSTDTQMIDSTHVKAHRSASGGKGGSRNRLLAARAEGATRRSTHSQMLKDASSPFC
ncbi:MAG TPA: ABC transporter substrate binding protein [Pseudolabrys sp.]|nr:ABC transporter substrate binding protein [Pseudolabrys sp.]